MAMLLTAAVLVLALVAGVRATTLATTTTTAATTTATGTCPTVRCPACFRPSYDAANACATSCEPIDGCVTRATSTTQPATGTIPAHWQTTTNGGGPVAACTGTAQCPECQRTTTDYRGCPVRCEVDAAREGGGCSPGGGTCRGGECTMQTTTFSWRTTTPTTCPPPVSCSPCDRAMPDEHGCSTYCEPDSSRNGVACGGNGGGDEQCLNGACTSASASSWPSSSQADDGTTATTAPPPYTGTGTTPGAQCTSAHDCGDHGFSYGWGCNANGQCERCFGTRRKRFTCRECDAPSSDARGCPTCEPGRRDGMRCGDGGGGVCSGSECVDEFVATTVGITSVTTAPPSNCFGRKRFTCPPCGIVSVDARGCQQCDLEPCSYDTTSGSGGDGSSTTASSALTTATATRTTPPQPTFTADGGGDDGGATTATATAAPVLLCRSSDDCDGRAYCVAGACAACADVECAACFERRIDQATGCDVCASSRRGAPCHYRNAEAGLCDAGQCYTRETDNSRLFDEFSLSGEPLGASGSSGGSSNGGGGGGGGGGALPVGALAVVIAVPVAVCCLLIVAVVAVVLCVVVLPRRRMTNGNGVVYQHQLVGDDGELGRASTRGSGPGRSSRRHNHRGSVRSSSSRTAY